MQAVFVYTREAHPGEVIGAHRTVAEKRSRAVQMADRWSVQRPMLVDSLDGALHKAYGTLPNMCWILGRGGTIVYKADWTNARSLDLVVRSLTWERARKGEGQRMVPFRVEWSPKRVSDRPTFLAGLLEAGPSAVDEYIHAMIETYGERSTREMTAWWAEHDPRPRQA